MWVCLLRVTMWGKVYSLSYRAQPIRIPLFIGCRLWCTTQNSSWPAVIQSPSSSARSDLDKSIWCMSWNCELGTHLYFKCCMATQIYDMTNVYDMFSSRYDNISFRICMKVKKKKKIEVIPLCNIRIEQSCGSIRARVLQLVASGLGCYSFGIRAGIGSLRAYR